MTEPSKSQEAHRKDALTAFLDERVSEGYRIETRTDTHAIIAPARRRWSFLDRFLKRQASPRHVISVHPDGEITLRPRAPLSPCDPDSRQASALAPFGPESGRRHPNLSADAWPAAGPRSEPAFVSG